MDLCVYFEGGVAHFRIHGGKEPERGLKFDVVSAERKVLGTEKNLRMRGRVCVSI